MVNVLFKLNVGGEKLNMCYLVNVGQLLDIALGITCSLEPVEVEEMMKISQVNHVCGYD